VVAEPVQPRLVIRTGHVWLSHRELTLIEQAPVPTTCEGKLRFFHTNGRLKGMQCDCCSYSVAATVEDVRAAARRRDELARAADFNREAWWNR
jgi:hypothetical protein